MAILTVQSVRILKPRYGIACFTVEISDCIFGPHFRRSHAHALDQPDSGGLANFVHVPKVAAIF